MRKSVPCWARDLQKSSRAASVGFARPAGAFSGDGFAMSATGETRRLSRANVVGFRLPQAPAYGEARPGEAHRSGLTLAWGDPNSASWCASRKSASWQLARDWRSSAPTSRAASGCETRRTVPTCIGRMGGRTRFSALACTWGICRMRRGGDRPKFRGVK